MPVGEILSADGQGELLERVAQFQIGGELAIERLVRDADCPT
ncbi:hypothetical protein [Sphingomonas faeni]|nr:hypothetical protein [Sphingomonas faeni]MDQ0839233.1 hypothetical protein [Sphingomonas faeni]MDQ0840050.1 hypothetical protein [Sphingomonas faeni]